MRFIKTIYRITAPLRETFYTANALNPYPSILCVPAPLVDPSQTDANRIFRERRFKLNRIAQGAATNGLLKGMRIGDIQGERFGQAPSESKCKVRFNDRREADVAE